MDGVGEYIDLSEHVFELYNKLNITFSDIYKVVKDKVSEAVVVSGVAVVYIPADAQELYIYHDSHGSVDENVIEEFKSLLRKLVNSEETDKEKELQRFAEEHGVNIYNISEYDETYLILF